MFSAKVRKSERNTKLVVIFISERIRKKIPTELYEAIATSHYINAFSGALGRDNFFGIQFPPEKSGAVGSQILKNFLEL